MARLRRLPNVTVVGDYWPIKEDPDPGDGSELLLRIPPELAGKVSVIRRGPFGEERPVLSAVG